MMSFQGTMVEFLSATGVFGGLLYLLLLLFGVITLMCSLPTGLLSTHHSMKDYSRVLKDVSSQIKEVYGAVTDLDESDMAALNHGKTVDEATFVRHGNATTVSISKVSDNLVFAEADGGVYPPLASLESAEKR